MALDLEPLRWRHFLELVVEIDKRHFATLGHNQAQRSPSTVNAVELSTHFEAASLVSEGQAGLEVKR